MKLIVSFRTRRLGFLCLLFLVLAKVAVLADEMPPPPFSELVGNQTRNLTLRLKIASDGKVQTATIEKSTGVPQLDKSTVDFMLENWDLPSHAGHKLEVPIVFIPFHRGEWTIFSKAAHSSGPPFPFQVDGYSGTTVLKVTFNEEGKPIHETIVRSCGSDLLDQEKVTFVANNWKAPPLGASEKGTRTMTVPINFTPARQ